MNKFYSTIIIVLSTCLLFIFFVIFSFPFGLVKIHLEHQLSTYVHPRAQIESIRFNGPLSLKINNLVLPANNNQASDSLSINKLAFGVSLLKLFAGKMNFWLYIDNKQKGKLDLSFSVSLFDLLSAKVTPIDLSFFCNNFALDSIIAYGVDFYARSSAANPLISPFLKQLSFYGSINSDVNFAFKDGNWINISGKANISSNNLKFSSSDPNLQIPEQLFEEAKIDLTSNEGAINIADTTKFKSQQLSLSLAGQIKLNKDLKQSNLKLEIPLEMSGDILNQLGVIVQMTLLRQDTWDGKAKINISGNILSPRITSTSS